MSHHLGETRPDVDTAAIPRVHPRTALALGTLLRGRYRLTQVIGRGGMADVYRATDEVLGRHVAIKAFRPGADGDSDRLRFLGEVRTLAGLAHPHLVRLFDGGQDDAQPWCAMHYLDGGTLADLILQAERGQGVDPRRVAAIGAQIADGLAYIHEQGIIHRDVKPSNVLLDAAGDAYLSDFGVAQLIDATGLTSTGTLLGTAAYLSPEQVQGAAATPAVDVYALGLVLLEALTGMREFPGAPVESAVARLSRPPQVPAVLGPDWVALLTAMTAADPQARPDAATVARHLKSRAAGLDEPVAPALPVPRSPALFSAPSRVTVLGPEESRVPLQGRPPNTPPSAAWRPTTWSPQPTPHTEEIERSNRLITKALALAPARTMGIALAAGIVLVGGWQVSHRGDDQVRIAPQLSTGDVGSGQTADSGAGLTAPSTGSGVTLAPTPNGMGHAGAGRRAVSRGQQTAAATPAATTRKPTPTPTSSASKPSPTPKPTDAVPTPTPTTGEPSPTTTTDAPTVDPTPTPAPSNRPPSPSPRPPATPTP